MKIEIIPVYENLDSYVKEVEKSPDQAADLWERYAIEPYWDKLCCYAPFDLSDRKPQAVTDIGSLKQQIKRLRNLDVPTLEKEFREIADRLPNYDDDPICVAIYPLSDSDIVVKERQNGVLGASTFGNMLIGVNPLADDFARWIPYVFAHEYHHTVWGNYWYALHGGTLGNEFIHSLLIDGEADHFARSLYPDLKPRWLFDLSNDLERSLWENRYGGIVETQNVDYAAFMFRDENLGIPWCAGYAIGYRIVEQFLTHRPETSIGELLEMNPLHIYKESRYAEKWKGFETSQ